MAAAMAVLLLAGCSSSDRAGQAPGTARSTGPSQVGDYKIGNPYQIRGVWYYPAENFSYSETGIASWYGPGFHGRRTANGERYDQHDLTAAHPTLPMPSLVQVTNLENGRSIKLRINDRGPFANGRIIDVSQRGAQLLGFDRQGTARVRVDILEEESRQLAAAARGEAPPPPRTPAPAPDIMVASVPVEPIQRETVPPPQAPAQPAPVLSAPVQPAPASAMQRTPVQSAPPVAPPPSSLPDGVVTQEAARHTTLFIQAGAFTEYDNASRLAQRLQPHGAVQIEPTAVEGRSFYRVRIGPVGTVDQADLLLDQLISDGYTESRVVVQ